jgi:hypothetical protein
MDSKKVILDASFVTRESADANHLKMLAKAGCSLVMIDSLPFELCTSKQENRWLHVQKKLMQCADHIEVWTHTGELLKAEVEENRPTASPIDEVLTEQTRAWFLSGRPYVPENIKEITPHYVQQREVDSVRALLSDCERLKGSVDELAKLVANKPHAATYDICFQFVNDARNIQDTLERNHGNASDPETFIPNAPTRIGPEWLAYHHAKCCLALLCLYVHKYGNTVTPAKWKDIENTTTDTDYLESLAFADALATNETSGDMERLFRWIFGSERTFVTIEKLDSLFFSHHDIATNAYQRWEESGYTHGHDLSDWLSAESVLHERVWQQLQ